MNKEKVPQYLAGLPVEVPNGNIAIIQPSIKDILAVMTETEYLEAVSLLAKIEDIGMELRKNNKEVFGTTPTFIIFLNYITQVEGLYEKVEKLFGVILPELEPFVSNNMILFKIEDHIVGQITPMNYMEFSNIISDLFLPYVDKKDKVEYKAANAKAQAIIDKIKKGKEQLQKQQDDKVGSIFASYASVLSVGLSIDLNAILRYTPFQLFDSYSRLYLKQDYEYYKRIASMPLMDASKMKVPKNWQENMYG